eukprot:g36614.t1
MDRLCQVKEVQMRGRVGHVMRPGVGEISKLIMPTLRPLGCRLPRRKYEVLFLKFLGGGTLEEAQDGHVTQGLGLGLGLGVEMVCNRKVLSFVTYREQVLYKAISEPPLGLPDVEEATSVAADAIDHIDGCAGEPLSDVKGLFGALDGGEAG